MTLHAHVDTYSVDCDGPTAHTYRMDSTAAEIASDFGDIEFHSRVVASVVNTYSLFQSGTLQVTSGEGAGYVARLEWSEATEEGHRSTTATICDSDCDAEGNTYRDFRAEENGY